MIVEFVGVGEAFEPELGNTSILVKSTTNVLVDCGYAVPARLFSRDYNCIDIIYLTHLHGDHILGLPALLTRYWEESRSKPLKFLGAPGTKRCVESLMEMAYPGVLSRLAYELEFVETVDKTSLNELTFSFAKTKHSVANHAVKIETPEGIVGISGDGAATAQSIELLSDCHFLIHETFTAETPRDNHGNAKSVVQFATEFSQLERLAFVHIQRDERKKNLPAFHGYAKGLGFSAVVASPGDIWTRPTS